MRASWVAPLSVVSAFMILSPSIASACYTTIPGVIVCASCDGGFDVGECTFGCDGDFCSVSYGMCCGQRYRAQGVSGTCEDQDCGGGGLAPSKAPRRLPISSRRMEGASSVVLIPSRCSGSYEISDGI